jgi:hypothetical protein
VKIMCLASSLVVCCKDKVCGFVDHSEAPAPAKVGETTDDRARSTDYALNMLYVLGCIANGDGCTEAIRLLGLLGLANDTTMQPRSFNIIEDRISPIIQSVTRQVLVENLKEEVKLTFAALPDQDNKDYELWLTSPSEAMQLLCLPDARSIRRSVCRLTWDGNNIPQARSMHRLQDMLSLLVDFADHHCCLYPRARSATTVLLGRRSILKTRLFQSIDAPSITMAHRLLWNPNLHLR